MKAFLDFKSIDEQINEVLSKDASAGEWIDDFVKSDNPKFAGKSKEKRKQMALAAYYAKQRNEEVELDEGWKDAAMGVAMIGALGAQAAHIHNKPHVEIDGNRVLISKHAPGSLSQSNSKIVTGADGKKYQKWRGPKGVHLAHPVATNEGTMQPNGTDKIIPDEGMCEGLCQVCGATDCKEHFYKSPAVTGYVKESAEHTVHVDDGSKYDEEPHPKDAEHVMAGVKKHGGKFAGHSDKGAYFKFGSRTDAKNFVDHVKKSPHRSVSADLHESRGHKILATAMANAERMKTVQIPTPAERRAELEKRNKEKPMKEATEKKPYIVISHVSDDTGTKADGEKVEKQRVATKMVATSPEEAIKMSKIHHTGKGRKVHSAAIKEDISVDEAVNTVKKDASGKVIAWSHEGDWEKMSTKKQGTGKAANLAGKALQKTKELNKEEVELEEGWEVYDTKTRAIHSSHPTQRKAQNAMNKLNDKHTGYETPGNLIASKFGARVAGLKEETLDEAAWGKDKATSLRQAHDRHMEKALAANKAGDDEAVKTHQRKMQMIQGKLQKLKNNEEVDLGEECEILSELSKGTLGSYVKKASEQGKKAAVSKNQSDRGATDALTKGNERLHNLHTDNWNYQNKLEKKRTAGVSKAVDKLTKEDTMVTYKEFMASIEEGRIDDLKDKLAADREKRLNKMDFSKEKPAAKNPVTKVKGHSYGAGDEEGEAETAKPAEPAEKRGRGRPAGSKSGARA